MMKCNKKQLVAFLLSVGLVCTMMPTTVLASDDSTLTDYTGQPVCVAEAVTASTGAAAETASVTFSESIIEDAIAGAQAKVASTGKTAVGISVELDVSVPEGATTLDAVLPADSLEQLIEANVVELDLKGALVGMTLSSQALASLQEQSSGDITFSISAVSTTGSAASLVGDRPAYNISINNGSITTFGGGSVSISIPYTISSGEEAGDLYAVSIDGSGNASRVESSIYQDGSDSMLLSSTYVSTFGIAYDQTSAQYADAENSFAADSINYVVSRGLISGTTDTEFEPDEYISRGELAEALGKMAGINTADYTTNSFTDVDTGSEEQPYIEWATQTGIMDEIADGLFVPTGSISRQKLAGILENYAEVTGFSMTTEREELTFADEGLIDSTYVSAVTTLQKAGVLMGKANLRYEPTYKATRAEVAVILTRYIALTIDGDAAQGFAMNDEGQWMYYEEGNALTGWQEITQDGETNTYYFSEYGIMATDSWVEVGGSWYYFGSDGKKVVSTTVGDYEVDASGARIE